MPPPVTPAASCLPSADQEMRPRPLWIQHTAACGGSLMSRTQTPAATERLTLSTRAALVREGHRLPALPDGDQGAHGGLLQRVLLEELLNLDAHGQRAAVGREQRPAHRGGAKGRRVKTGSVPSALRLGNLASWLGLRQTGNSMPHQVWPSGWTRAEQRAKTGARLGHAAHDKAQGRSFVVAGVGPGPGPLLGGWCFLAAEGDRQVVRR